jgi:hypothetical protein
MNNSTTENYYRNKQSMSLILRGSRVFSTSLIWCTSSSAIICLTVAALVRILPYQQLSSYRDLILNVIGFLVIGTGVGVLKFFPVCFFAYLADPPLRLKLIITSALILTPLEGLMYLFLFSLRISFG